MREAGDKNKTAEIEPQQAADVAQETVDNLQLQTELEALDQTRSHLIANLVHDLRTPLVSIRGYTKMILEDRAGTINTTQREYLSIVAENTNRVIQLLSNLVRLTSNEPLRFQVFDARELSKEALGFVKARLVGQSVRISERVTKEPLLVLGDKQKLTEVFTNLLYNAVKFTDAGGEVGIHLGATGKGEVSATISDTGVGIPQEILSTLLHRGASADGSASTRGSFSVGLSVVQDIIRLHGGHLSVSSKTGEGVTFLITLPAV